MSCVKSHHKQKIFTVPFLGSSCKIRRTCTFPFCACVGSQTAEVNLGSESQGCPAGVSPSGWFSCPFLHSTYFSVVSSSLRAGARPSGTALSHCWAQTLLLALIIFSQMMYQPFWVFPGFKHNQHPTWPQKMLLQTQGKVGCQQAAVGRERVDSFFQTRTESIHETPGTADYQQHEQPIKNIHLLFVSLEDRYRLNSREIEISGINHDVSWGETLQWDLVFMEA